MEDNIVKGIGKQYQKDYTSIRISKEFHTELKRLRVGKARTMERFIKYLIKNLKPKEVVVMFNRKQTEEIIGNLDKVKKMLEDQLKDDELDK